MAAKNPEDVDRLFAEHLNAGDAAGVAALYEPDGVLVNPDGEARGRTAIQQTIQGLIDAKLQLQMHVTKVIRSGDTALLYNDWTSTLNAAGDAQSMSGKALEIVRRQADGSWLFLIDDPYARS